MTEGENADDDMLKSCLMSRCFEEYYFTLMAKQNVYNGEIRIDYTVCTCESAATNYNKAVSS